MRLGFTGTSLLEAEAIAESSCDFLEIKGDLLMGEESEFQSLARALGRLAIPVEAMTSPLPRSIGVKIAGPDADHGPAMALLELCLSRAAALGAQVAVFGCSQARMVPADFPRQKASEQIISFLGKSADVARRRGIRLGIEPLWREETNMVNSAEQAREIVNRVGCAEVGITLDYFHVVAEKCSLQRELDAVEGCLVHVQTADPDTRAHPGKNPQAQLPLLNSLHERGYDGRISVECLVADPFGDTRSTVRSLRPLLERVPATSVSTKEQV